MKIEPLPVEHFNSISLELGSQVKNKLDDTCYECKKIIKAPSGLSHKARAEHYMQFSQEPFHTCPICLFTIPTFCGLLAHMRIHLKIPPYYCPECGFNLPNRNISYPYSHDCDGFKMMRATARAKCPVENCETIVHPSEYQSHLKSHYNMLMKCQMCFETFSNRKDHKCPNAHIVFCFQCPLCSEKISLKSQIDKHLNAHLFIDPLKDVYQCHICKTIFTQMHFLLNHIVVKHGAVAVKKILSKIIRPSASKNKKNGLYHRIVKRCDKCLVTFTYRCLYENIDSLPIQCPYKCSSLAANNSKSKKTSCPNSDTHDNFIVCSLCKNKIKEDWNTIKEHFASFHKTYKCLDLKIKLNKIDKRLTCLTKNKRSNIKITKNAKTNCKRKVNSLIELKKTKSIAVIEKNNTTNEGMTDHFCRICNYKCETKLQLEDHIVMNHKDPFMAYQCLECGQCFAVKRSFATHLLLEHEIFDVQIYIDTKQCYNELALQKNPMKSTELEEKPVQENQCKICREQFTNSNDLEKHFRVHGMAFLMKNRNSVEK